jgi:N-acetylmuramic acid 6-phosphate etherase
MSLANLTTEGRNPDSVNLDQLTAIELVRLMNAQDAGVPAAVAAVEESIAAAVELIADKLEQGGRLIYLGAGTSGRLGVLDAAECPPTFNSHPWQVVGLIAGGPTALTRAVEGAEDHPELGRADLESIECACSDVVVGIATSGRTPYVIGGLQYARSVGAATIGLACNAASQLAPHCDIEIAPIVGPEVVTGSTRLKAGTATKLVLNTLTTGAMVRLGKTYGNLMVDLQATNQKLADRSARIVSMLANVPREQAEELLRACDGDVKTAIIAHRRSVSPDVARSLLRQAHGRLRPALESEQASPRRQPGDTSRESTLVLGIDGGGSSTRAWLVSTDSDNTVPVGVGEAATSNPQSVGWAAALGNIDLAVRRAFRSAAVDRGPVDAVCLAIAGTGREVDRQRLQRWAEQQRLAETIITTHDADPILMAGTTEGIGVALICGTGSFAYGKNAAGETARAGGWGHVLGDEGSGYAIAVAGLRAAVHAHEGTGPATRLGEIFTQHLGIAAVEDLRDFTYGEGAGVRRTATLAPLVLAAVEDGDEVAISITDRAAADLARLVASVHRRLFRDSTNDSDCEIALAGGLLTHTESLRERLQDHVEQNGIAIARMALVKDPVAGTILLARRAVKTGRH